MADDENVSPSIERRMVLQLLHQWREAGGGESFPELDDIDHEALEEIWHDCYVLGLASARDEMKFLQIGKSILAGCAEDYTGRLVSEVSKQTLLYHSAAAWDRVIKKAVPISMGGHFENAAGKTTVYRSILLPLGDGSGSLQQILGAVNGRILAED